MPNVHVISVQVIVGNDILEVVELHIPKADDPDT